MSNADTPAMAINHGTIEKMLGLTKREHFAAMAMQGLCNACDEDGTWSHDAEIVAEAAVAYADALLAALDDNTNKE